MPPFIDLEPYKAEIISLFHQNQSTSDISSTIEAKYHVRVRERTIKSRLSGWELASAIVQLPLTLLYTAGSRSCSLSDASLMQRFYVLYGMKATQSLHEHFDESVRSKASSDEQMIL
ncbi:hypothetical protein AnigIFM63604_003317, partial [Aspergillus niger]